MKSVINNGVKSIFEGGHTPDNVTVRGTPLRHSVC